MRDTTALILAAGLGKRLGEITKDKPKVLIEVGNKTLLAQAIEFMKKIGLTNIIVVGGYYFDKVKAEAERIDPNIKLVNNTEYALQNLTSLAKALPWLDGKNVLVCNADYVFKETTAQAVAGNLKDISIYCSFDLSGNDEDVMRVKTDGQGNLVEMSKQLKDFDSIYTGIFFIASQHIPELKEITGEILKKYDTTKTTVEYLFKEFLARGKTITAQDVGPADWLEIDTPEELAAAQQAFNPTYQI